MLDFPASPTLGQQFTAAGVTWVFDGTKWLPSGLSPTVAPGINDNRIINGDMRIDQRGVASGAGGTAVSYMVDRWFYQANTVGKGTWGRGGPGYISSSGMQYYLGFTSSSAYAPLAGDYFNFYQNIEADMVSDFAWGSAAAQPATLSFWAYSSLTGTFGGTVQNAAATRSYPFTYSIPVASIWTRIVITIPGDTTGTWTLAGNGVGVHLALSLGVGSTYAAGSFNAWASGNYISAIGAVNVVGTNAATFYVTGVKLEIGSVATSYNRQSLAKSMADCQRYYQSFPRLFVGGYNAAAQNTFGCYSLPVAMRAAPTVAFGTISYVNASGLTANNANTQYLEMFVATTATGACVVTFPVTLSAEL